MTKRITPLMLIIPWMLICLIGAAMLSGFDLEAPTLAFGSVLALAPLIIYIALKRPFGFPFALYAVFAEFDHLFPPGPLGTVAKIGGLLVSFTLLVKLVHRKRLTKPGPEVLAWFVFFAWACISLIWTADTGVGMREMQQYFSLFFLYVLLSIATADATDMRMVVIAVIGSGVMAALFGLSSYHSSQMGSATSMLRTTLSNGSLNNFVDPNHMAASLQMPFSLLLITMFRERNVFLKICYFLGCAILVGGLLVTGSRAGVIGVGAIFLFLLLRSRHRLQITTGGIIALLLSLAIPTVWTRFGDQTSGEFGGRLPIWHVVWTAFKDHWIIGRGIGSLSIAYDEALLETFQLPAYFHRDVTSHNIFLYTGVQLGIIGVMLLTTAWWFQFRALKNIQPGNVFYDLRLALEAGTLALLIEACTLDLLTFKYLWVAFSITEIVRGVHARIYTTV
jgi:O-antigen ligase